MTSEYFEKVTKCANKAKELQIERSKSGCSERMYLYHKQSIKGAPGEIVMVPASENAPEGYDLATGEGLSTAVPYEYYFQWIYERAKRSPILSID